MYRKLQQIKNTPYFTYLFLAIQTAVFILAFLFPRLQLEFRGAVFGPSIAYFQEYWRFVTPIFIHYGLMHFAVNSVVLYFMGQQVESLYGHWRFFIIYIFSGIAGNVLGFAFNPPMVQAAGASTSLFGLFGAFVILGIYYKDNYAIRGMVRQFTLFLAMNLIFGFLDQSVDILGHVGGLIGGVLLGNIMGLPKSLKDYSIHIRILSGIIYIAFIIFCLLYGFRKYSSF